jgi:signal peptidase I
METGANHFSLPYWLRVVLIGRNPKFTLVRIAITTVLLVSFFKFVLLPIRVQGPSMLPTYDSRGVNFVNRLAFIRSEPRRGDVIAIRYSGTHTMLMKRVIGLPGETVEFHRGDVLIDGTKLPEPYITNKVFQGDWTLPPETLAADEYFVVGDNRSMPSADHTFGRAKRYRIIGKIFLCKNLFVSWLH